MLIHHRYIRPRLILCFFFFFNDTATTEIYTLSLHDALPIFQGCARDEAAEVDVVADVQAVGEGFGPGEVVVGETERDRKSTRLNSSHANISYAVFCLKKKTKHKLSSHILNITHKVTTSLYMQ